MKKIKNHPFLQINPVRGGFAAGGINPSTGQHLWIHERQRPDLFPQISFGHDRPDCQCGPISYFTNLAPNTKVNINAYTGTQFGQVGTNNLAWSALAYFDNTASPAALRNTIFMTNPRYDLNTQTTPYYCDTYNARVRR